VLDTASKFALF